jgi:hypothetical protein
LSLQFQVLYGKLAVDIVKLSTEYNMSDEATNRLSVSGRVLPSRLMLGDGEKSIATLPRIEIHLNSFIQKEKTFSNNNKNAYFPRIPLSLSRRVSSARIVKINRQLELIESVLSPSESAPHLKSIGNFQAFLRLACWTCTSRSVISLERAGVPGGTS